LFGLLNKYLEGKQFNSDKEVKTEVPMWFRSLSLDFCSAGIKMLVQHWDKCLKHGGNYVEK
jgi:hypothetical protein